MAEHEVTEAMVTDAEVEAAYDAFHTSAPDAYEYGPDDIRAALNAFLHARAALAARTTDASAASGAVAWQYRYKTWLGDWSAWRDWPRDDDYRNTAFEYRPLFTHHTGAGADADALDAARYRWLRDHIHYCRDDEHAYPYATVKVYFDRDERGSVSRMTVWPCDGVGAASLNTAIDAAMLASSPQQRAGDGG